MERTIRHLCIKCKNASVLFHLKSIFYTCPFSTNENIKQNLSLKLNFLYRSLIYKAQPHTLLFTPLHKVIMCGTLYHQFAIQVTRKLRLRYMLFYCCQSQKNPILFILKIGSVINYTLKTVTFTLSCLKHKLPPLAL